MEKDAKIYIAGHQGLIGAQILKRLEKEGFSNLIYRSRQELDLTRQAETESFFKAQRPQYVILAAARVGGIQANIAHPAEFIFENLAIQNNVIHSAYLSGVRKLLFFGSACSYPREAPQPMKEEHLLTGTLEPSNEPYAVAKIAGMRLCQAYNREHGANFISAVLTNAYGPGDNFKPESSHVIPALIRRFYEAKINKLPSVAVWGSGRIRRQFIYAEDAAGGALFLMNNYDSSEIINLAAQGDIAISDLARTIKEAVGYTGEVIFDTSKPDGIARKMLDASKLKKLGWQAKTSLSEGIKKTYEWYKNQGQT